MVRFTLNGRPVEALEGATVLQACRAAGIDVPTLCHDDRLKPASACRLCEVEVEGQERPLCACATPVTEGMAVHTHTPALEDFRRGVLQLLTEAHPGAHPGSPFASLLDRYGVNDAGAVRTAWKEDHHPHLKVDLGACIDCFRCVRICHEVAGRDVWRAFDRGSGTRVGVAGASLMEAGCVSCGACADTCPTGAITHRAPHDAVDHWTRTICPYCGTGCELEVGVAKGRIVQIKASLDAHVNHGHLCVKGRYGSGFVDAHDRILHPMIRRSGRWVRVSWDEALDAAAELLTRTKREHGPAAIGVLGSSRGTNEEAFLTHKLARLALGTGNVDCCARVCHAPSAAGLGQIFGTGASTNGFDDVELAEALLVVGANPTENHPIVGDRIRQRARAGVPLIVIDPRRTDLAAEATVHLALRPGTNLPLLQAMAHVIIAEGLADQAFLAKRADGFEAYAEHLKPWTPEAAAKVCGVEASEIVRAARIYASHRPAWACNGLGLTEHRQGTDGVIALAHLALLTGNLGVPGGGVNPLRGQNNVQGTAQMGCEPKRLTGYQPFDSARAAHEAAWGRLLPPPGLDAIEMVDQALESRLKALLVIGYDVLLSHPQYERTAKALEKLDGLIVVDLFLNETAEAFGTIFLPAASSFEKEGTFMNGERRIQRVRAAFPPPGECQSDQWILIQLARRLGFAKAFNYESPIQVWDEVRHLWPAVAGITYARLESDGLQWPCPTEQHPGTRVLHTDRFPIGEKATFRLLEWTPTPERTDTDHPFLLSTGRSLYHFNAATMTDRSSARRLQLPDGLEIHPGDAEALAITEGMPVTLQSRHGTIQMQARLTTKVRRGELFCTFHATERKVNRITGPGRDPVTHTPEYKVTAVHLEGRNPGGGSG
jgi:formate dehydrogenase major subunit